MKIALIKSKYKVVFIIIAFIIGITFFFVRCNNKKANHPKSVTKTKSIKKKEGKICDSLRMFSEADLEILMDMSDRVNLPIDTLFEDHQYDDNLYVPHFPELDYKIMHKFSDTTIGNYNYFDHLKYINDFSLYKVNFEKKIDFEKSIFVKKGLFVNSYFKKSADFHNCTFQDVALFSHSDFKGKTDFFNCSFKKLAKFIWTSFDFRVNFEQVKYKSDVKFENCFFHKSVSFKMAYIPKRATFLDCNFSSSVDFSNLTLTDSTLFNFKKCILPDTIDFSYNNKINNEIDLTDADFTYIKNYDKKNDNYFKPHFINLFKSDVSKFRLDYTHFRILTQNGKNKISVDEMDGLYEALLNNFKSHGQIESFKLLDIEYQKFKWKNSNFPWMSIVLEQWWNFGYNKERIFLWTFVFLLVFTIFTFLMLPYIVMVYPIKTIGNAENLKFKPIKIKKIFIRLWFALAYSSSIFFGLTLKIEEIRYKMFWGTLYIVLMYSAGIICLAYMANFIIQK